MSIGFVENIQRKYNDLDWNALGKGTANAKESSDDFKNSIENEKQKRSRVTMQAEPLNPIELTDGIKGDMENAIRPEAGQAPKREIGQDFTFDDMQAYANKRGRELQKDRVQETNHIVSPLEQGQNNYQVRSTIQLQEENDNKVQVNENERG